MSVLLLIVVVGVSFIYLINLFFPGKHKKMVAKYSPGKYSDDPVAACEADEKLRLVKDVFDNVLKQQVFIYFVLI